MIFKNKIKVAICFWGICRSTDRTIHSIQNHIFNQLKSAGIEYHVFMHTYALNRVYTNIRSNEHNVRLNNDLWRLLNPDYFIIDDQDQIDQKLQLLKYRTHGCPWNSVHYQTLNNHVRALYSLHKVTGLVETTGIKYDIVIFCRPDLLFITPIMSSYFTIDDHTILLSNIGKYPINDGFAICNLRTALIYGHRYLRALDYSKRKPLHAETFLDYTLKMHGIKIKEINILFYKIRANGNIQK